ncbi:MAG: type II toxin-antitoxin system VapC family toxin [Deltaproteobacteria bacterium]
MILFLDTSVLLRVLLNQRPLLPEWATWTRAYASEILLVEARRAVDRHRLAANLNDSQITQAHAALRSMENGLEIVSLDRAILERASLPMPSAVGTLDAIHLVSALFVREMREPDLQFATHDHELGRAAQGYGFTYLGQDT